ncbi:low temperature requirement protein A [Streptococcus sobrinus]|uniref:low temperature requirement protein A n=1 Tax=Streptococcus sobrinus TaxID=1310 RepID=UPI000D7083E0|nr:low temperature requirement protein A [Streptococcus sobrinus]AWN62184.1 low temperature requirement protein A [Streptococcus sobrinus]AWN64058.1 low temperature requirement protein A [Streptococcus sobrinus]SQG21103.1 low temperature requirement A [Streptococcus sobrinus]
MAKKIVSKRVSNYELFYDLVFVLAMSRMTSYLHTGHFHLGYLAAFIVSNSLVMSIWTYQTIYLNKYGERDPLDVYLNIPSMFIVGNFALMLGMKSYNLSEYLLYNGLLILAHALIAFQYYLRGRRDGFNVDMISIIKRLMVTIAYFGLLVLAVAVLNLFDSNNSNLYWLWLIPWSFPLFINKGADFHQLNFPHLVERFQLITIISFGETVVGLIQSYPLYQSPFLGILFFFGVSFMFVAFISQTHLTINHHQKTRGTVLIYAHLILIIAINMLTTALENFASPEHRHFALAILSFGLFFYYLALYATSIYNRRLYRFAKVNYLPYMICASMGIGLMWVFHSWPLAVAIVFAATCFIIHRLNFYARRQAREAQKKQ